MKSSLQRYKHSASSTQAYRSYCAEIDAFLYANAAPENTYEALLLLRLLPLGKRSLVAMFYPGSKRPTTVWMELRFGNQDSKRIIWNACAGMTTDQWNRLHLIFTQDHVAELYLNEMIPFRRRSKRGAAEEFALILEADCPLQYPQALVSYANYSADLASPDSIDLEGSCGWISRETINRGNLSRSFPGFFESINLLKHANNTVSRLELLEHLRNAAIMPFDEADKKAINYLDRCIHANILAGKKKPSVNSRLRYLSEIPYLLTALKLDEVPVLSGHRRQAIHYLHKVDSILGKKLDIRFQDASYPANPLDVNLFSLDATYREFGLFRSYPDLQDQSQYKAACERIIMILLSTGRRLSCLTDITSASFHTWNGQLSVQLGQTKVESEKNGSIPLSALLSFDDLAYIKQFLSATKHAGLAGRNILFDTGIQSFLTRAQPKAYEIDTAFAKLLSSNLGRNTRLRLHDLRRMALSWLVIRFTLVLSPDFSDWTVLRNYCSHGVFSADATQRLKRHLIPHSGVDILGTIASLAGHSSRQTFRKRYNYSLPILSVLYASKQWSNIEPFIKSKAVVERTRNLLFPIEQPIT